MIPAGSVRTGENVVAPASSHRSREVSAPLLVVIAEARTLPAPSSARLSQAPALVNEPSPTPSFSADQAPPPRPVRVAYRPDPLDPEICRDQLTALRVAVIDACGP